MKKYLKIIISLILLIVFLITCFFVFTFGYIGFWLHTYNVFTKKTPVAEITISALKQDEKGSYAIVDLQIIKGQSALSSIFVNDLNYRENIKEQYKLYGDTIYIGGPIIKFHDNLILFNFETVYKIGKIFSRYELDKEKEKERSIQTASSYEINGGFNDWKVVHDNLTSDNILGKFYRLFIDTTQISMPGQFVSNKDLKYTLYITNTGYLWKLSGDVAK